MSLPEIANTLHDSDSSLQNLLDAIDTGSWKCGYIAGMILANCRSYQDAEKDLK